MRTGYLVCTALLLAASAFGQRHKLTAINAETEEGKILQGIMQETDQAKRIALMEQFIAQHGKHDGVGWVYSQMQTAYAKAGNHDKVVEVGEKLLAMDAGDLEAAYANLKASEARKDVDAIVKWSGVTSEIARKTVTGQKPAEMEDDLWKQSVDYAKQVDTYTEYALYAVVMQNNEPPKIMQAVETLEQRAPESQYVAQVLGRYAMAARQANALDKAIALGEKTFARNQVNEDMLLAMADFYFSKNQQPDKVVSYANKVVEVMEGKPKPEGVADADWDKKKNTTVGVAHWMSGMTLAGQSKWPQADKSLREALPLIKDNDQLMGPALFNLGLANYRMGQAGKNKGMINEALKFSQQSAAIKGPYQGRAAGNVKAIRHELGLR